VTFSETASLVGSGAVPLASLSQKLESLLHSAAVVSLELFSRRLKEPLRFAAMPLGSCSQMLKLMKLPAHFAALARMPFSENLKLPLRLAEVPMA